MSAILVAARAVHFASALLVFGTFAFTLFVGRPCGRDAASAAPDWSDIERRLRGMLLWALAVSAASLVLWLALEVPLMSGERLEDALAGPTFGIVVTQTWFGRVFASRVALALVLAAWLTLGKRAALRSWAALATAGAYVALPALAGHAAGGLGVERYARLVADMVHLLAAGAWLGALPALALTLLAARREPASIDFAARVTQRFSSFGTVGVALLVVSGTVNAVYLVRRLDALTGSEYGKLLLAKLAFVAAMLALAAVNRWSLSPRIAAGDRGALGALARSTALETAAGLAVVAIVGALGITVPPMHSMHHELHSGTSRAIISSSFSIRSSIRTPPWPNPTSSTSRCPKASTTISKPSSDPMPFRRTAWIWRCSTVS